MSTNPSMQGSITSDDIKTVVQMAHDWIDALVSGRFEWMEPNLASDFLFTSHLIPGYPISKAPFIDAVKGTRKARIDFVSCEGEAAGKVILLRTVLYVDEEFTADLGPGMPSAEEITRLLSKRVHAYVSAYRRAGSGWQCFDHHQIGPVD
jgi:hypothetical protein